jgi:hypothetical protein
VVDPLKTQGIPSFLKIHGQNRVVGPQISPTKTYCTLSDPEIRWRVGLDLGRRVSSAATASLRVLYVISWLQQRYCTLVLSIGWLESLLTCFTLGALAR